MKHLVITELLADREEEEYNTEMPKQFAAFENIRKPNTGLELQVVRPFLLNLNSEENNPQHSEKSEVLKRIQLSADIQESSEGTLF